MSKGVKVLLITLAVAGIVALSAGSIAMAAAGDTGDQIRDRVRDCDETCQQQCLQEQQRLCDQNETCIPVAEQNRTRLNWQDDICPGNTSGQQDENQTKVNRFGQD